MDLPDLPPAVLEAFRVDVAACYRRSTRRKDGGGTREIAEPVGVLREAQEWLAEKVWGMLPAAPCAHGYVPGRSILTHATVHAPSHTLLTMDVHDFFGSFKDEAVVELLAKALPLSLAVGLARLCCHPAPLQGLPQGAPTSPRLANACFYNVDAVLTAVAKTYYARYSRYVDDLAFSWAAEPLPNAVQGAFAQCVVTLWGAGFLPAFQKTRLAGPADRHLVTGLVVNAAPGRPAVRAPRERWRTTRAALDHAEKRGPNLTAYELDTLQGHVGFLAMTDPERAAPLAERVAALREAARWLAR